MAQYTGEVNKNTILSQDWGAEDAQWTGADVQQGLKDVINSKNGYTQMYKKYICTFKDKETYERWLPSLDLSSDLVLSISKIDYNELVASATVDLTGTFGGKDIATATAADTFTVTKDIAKLQNLVFKCSYFDDDTNSTVQLEDNVLINWYIKLNGQTIKAGTTYNKAVIDTIDLSEFVSSTKSQFLIYCEFYSEATGSVSTEKNPKTLSIQLNDYKLSFDNDLFWKSPWIRTQNTDLALRLEGSTNNEKVTTILELWQGNSRKMQYTSNALTPSSVSSSILTIPNEKLSNLAGGVYNLRVHFEYNNTSSPVISKNIMLKTNDSDTANYLCANLESTSFTNYTSTVICKYIVNGSITKVAQSIGTLSSDKIISNEEIYTFSTLLNIESDLDTIDATVTLADLVKVDGVDKTNTTYFSETVLINNKNRFTATTGAVIDIDPSGQTSGSDEIWNSAGNGSYSSGLWNNMTWGDNDGWIQDSDGINILKIPKESKLTLNENLFRSTSSTEDFTIEIVYKIENATDESDVVISCSSDGDTFYGIRIYPSKIDYRPSTSTFNIDQVTNLASDEFIHLTLVYNSNYSGWGGQEYTKKGQFPITKIYVNGKITREIWSVGMVSNKFSTVFGGQNSDLSIYKIRKYNTALSDANIFKNFLNCYNSDLEDRINKNTKFSLIYDSNQISFAKAKDNFNCFVFSSETYNERLPHFWDLNDKPKNVLPGISNNVTVTDALIELYWDKENFPGNENVKIQLHPVYDEDGALVTDNGLKYLGSSSKDYYRWNWRTKFTKGCTLIHENGKIEEDTGFTMYTSYSEDDKGNKTPTWGVNCSVLTGKKNFASSMQSHKMGSCNAYDAVFLQLAIQPSTVVNMENNKQITLAYANLRSTLMSKNGETSKKNIRNAIWQAPFLGFIKVGDEYVFIGLYTIGPDKGDKKVNGFDNKLYPELTEYEGAEQPPRFDNFTAPWDEDLIHPKTDEPVLFYFSKDTTESWEITGKPLYYFGNIVKEIHTGEGLPDPSLYSAGDTLRVMYDYDNTAEGSDSSIKADTNYTLVQTTDEETEEVTKTWEKSKQTKWDETNATHTLWWLNNSLRDAYIYLLNHTINIVAVEGDVPTNWNTFTYTKNPKYYMYWFTNDPTKSLYWGDIDTSGNITWQVAKHKWTLDGEVHEQVMTLYSGVYEDFVPSIVDTVNGQEVTRYEEDMTAEELNEAFKTARAVHFRDGMSQYWNVADTLTWWVNVELHAGTDERAKNIYMYKCGSLAYVKVTQAANAGTLTAFAEGTTYYEDTELKNKTTDTTPQSGKTYYVAEEVYKYSKKNSDNTWRWRVDDMDTRFDVDNEGRTNKKYFIELGDSQADLDAPGDWDNSSALTNLLHHDAFYSLKKDVFDKTLRAMSALSGGKGDGNLDDVLKFYDKYYWKYSADYFTEMGYNEDAIFCYDLAKAYEYIGYEFKVSNPLRQSLGDHKLADRKFIKDRINYLATKYVYTPIVANDIFSLGRGVTGTLHITYDGWLYPTYYLNATGAENMTTTGVRTAQGGNFDLYVESQGTASSAIGSKSLISDIGNNWNEIVNTGVGLAFSNMPRLKTLNISGYQGDFTISNNVNLKDLDISGCSKAADAQIDIINSTHLKTINALNTPLTVLRPASGAPVTSLKLPTSITELYMDKLSKLTDTGLNFSNWSNLTKVFIRNCDATIKPLDKIFNIIRNAQKNNTPIPFTNVYISGLNETWSADVASQNIETLKDFANLGLNGYSYDDVKGYYTPNEDKASLSGTITVNCDYFKNDLITIKKNIVGDLTINTSKTAMALVKFNNAGFLKLVHDYMIVANPSQQDVFDELQMTANNNSLYENFVIWNLLTQNNNQAIEAIASTSKTVITDNTASTMGTNPDFTDWGTWFPNYIPKFLFGHSLSGISLGMEFTNKSNSVDLTYITSGSSQTTNNYRLVSIEGTGTTCNLQLRSYQGSTSVGMLAIDRLNINAAEITFGEFANSILSITDMYLNTNKKVTINNETMLGGNNLTSTNPSYYIKNIYIDQNLYWDYLSDTRLVKRVISYNNNYIPYSFLNSTVGSLSEHPIYSFSDSHMLTSRNAFYVGDDITGSYFYTNATFSITFATFISGSSKTYLFGNKNIYASIDSNNTLFVYIVDSGQTGHVHQFSNKIEIGAKYTLTIAGQSDDTLLTLYKNGVELESLNKDKNGVTVKGHTRFAAPYAFGSYNTYSSTSGDVDNFADKISIATSNFVGAIFNVNVKNRSGLEVLNINPELTSKNESKLTDLATNNVTILSANNGYYKTIVK